MNGNDSENDFNEPSENQDEALSPLKGIFLIIKMILMEPRKFFHNIEIENSISEPYLFYLKVTIPLLVIKYASEVIMTQGQVGFSNIIRNLGVLALAQCVGIFFYAGFMHLPVMLFGGRGGFYGTFYICAFATAAVAIFGLIPYAGNLIGGIWGVYIFVTGYQIIHQFSMPRAVCIYFIIPLLGFSLILYNYFQESKLAEVKESYDQFSLDKKSNSSSQSDATTFDDPLVQ